MGQQCNGYLKVQTTTKTILCEMVWDNNATDILRLKQQQRRSLVNGLGQECNNSTIQGIIQS